VKGDLPQGWTSVPLKELVGDGVFTDGDWVESKDQDPNGAVRLIQLADVGVGRFLDKSSRFLTNEKAAELRCTFLEPGDVLVSRMADPIGRACIFHGSPQRCVTVVDVCIVRPGPGRAEARWLTGAINSPTFRRTVEVAASGTTRSRISRGNLGTLNVPVPPLNEQRRIVAKLEALQARSRRAREALDAVPPLLEKLRQSILAAAFRGDLTKDWRAKHKDVEPASKLLERIRAERRKKWEEGELAKVMAKGKAPKGDEWKAKYKEPEAADVAEMPALPEGWCWAPLPTLGELARGKSKHRPRNDPALFGDAMPFIQTGEVARSGGRIIAHSSAYSAFGVAQSRVFPRDTVCITIAANIADTGILQFDACFPDSVVGFVADAGSVAASYVELFIRTARADLKRFAPATAQANINLEVLGKVAVPVPPQAEMVLLVERVERAMALVAAIASSHCSTGGKLQILEQATLAKAFRGELVPQDRNDEPAEAMPARVWDGG
jgi:type I restriction enzyme, S subunit